MSSGRRWRKRGREGGGVGANFDQKRGGKESTICEGAAESERARNGENAGGFAQREGKIRVFFEAFSNDFERFFAKIDAF